MKILIATDKPFAKVAVDGIRNEVEGAGFELALLEKYTEKQQLLDAVADADAVIVRSDIIDAEVISAAKKMKIVVRAGAGYDNIDLDAATKAGVCVMNTPGQNANAVAELAFGLMIYGIRNYYNGTSGTELKGKRLGIHAYGNIGRNVARIAKGFGMEISAYDIYCRAEDIKTEGVNPTCSAKTLYQSSDVISINVPYTEETKQFIGKELLNLLPKGAIMVNTARKEVINEPELLEYMLENPKFKYLTDIAADMHEEFKAKVGDRYYATVKKMGAQTEEANINAGIAAAQQIVDFIKNGVDKYRVNK
ncbi:D-3-phosphoglycerate dehydrogenase [uncultured Paludibacter sp.]|uniref:D-3-phosphoglycerate dehydrogenase n=1 Tax=uncultured Paludibacter sp. TaxID=497635 RepID=A0A653AFB6_9BACT|nr:D-3-phosphoglycerate dehydrogenase [uncultured Paludibacter sp.]